MMTRTTFMLMTVLCLPLSLVGYTDDGIHSPDQQYSAWQDPNACCSDGAYQGAAYDGGDCCEDYSDSDYDYDYDYDYDFDPVAVGPTWQDDLPPCNCCTYGVWMPECPVLFKPLMADPRQVTYSGGWRWNDRVFVKNVIDISYGDSFPAYRWWNLFLCGDALQIDLEGGLWAIFDPLHDSSPLVNADYYIGFPVTYAIGNLSFRLRPYHISSHIGDEFLMNHPRFVRLNPSAEYLDLFASYQITPELRLYAGYGYILERDSSFPFKRNYLEWGVETYFRRFQFYSCRSNLSGEPFFAMHFRCREDNHWREDGTYVLGYEFSKHSGLCRKLRLFLQYHNGFSCEGQFSRFHTHYLAIRASYGY